MRFGGRSGVLYAGILRGDNGNLAILRKADFNIGTTLMTILLSRASYDQPWVEASTAATDSNTDRVFVSGNDLSQKNTSGHTASVDFSLNAATLPPPAGFNNTIRLETRARAVLPASIGGGNQDGPSVRTSIHSSGVIYGIFFGWRTFSSPNVSDVVVVRDDNWASGATPFQALIDPIDLQPGLRVVTNANIANLANTLGTQRIGSQLAIAVDPLNSQRVYIAWCDGLNNSASPYTLHGRKSGDGGQNWTGDLFATPNSNNPALAVNTDGKVALLYQELVNTNGVNRRRSHLALSTNHFATVLTDIILANVLDSSAGSTRTPVLGDYINMIAIRKAFYGVFSAFNVPDNANFPNGVTYLRNSNFVTKQLLSTDGVTQISPSEDAFFFQNVSVRCYIMAFFQNFDNKNFELVVPIGGGQLQHYWMDYGGGTNRWNPGAPVYG